MVIIIFLILIICVIRYLVYIKHNENLEVNIKQYFNINGIEQYLTIRGKKSNAPILIILHGGPNASLIPYSFAWQKELENNYIVVNYDQRLCGRTAMKNRNIKEADQEELIEDLKGIVDCLKDMFKFEKVNLMGHSGGTILGMDFIEKYPELVENYIGISQIYNFKKAINTELKNFLETKKMDYIDKYEIKKNIEKSQNLESVQDIKEELNVILKFSKQPEPLLKLLILPIISPYMGIRDFWYFIHSKKGNEKYGFLKFNLEDRNINPNIQYIFILGENDHTICPELLKDFARNKENVKVYLINKSGHVPMYSNISKFNEILNNCNLM